MANTITSLTFEIGKLLTALEEVFARAASTKSYLNFLGWELPPGLEEIGLAGIDFAVFLEKLRVVAESSEAEWQDELVMASRVAELASATARLVEEIRHLAEALPDRLAAQGDYVSRTNIHKELPRRVLDLLIAGYLTVRSPLLFSIFNLLNIVEYKHFEADEENFQVEHVRAIVHYDYIRSLFSDPAAHMREAYGWGTPAFAVLELLTRIGRLLRALGASTRLQPMDRRVEQALVGEISPDFTLEPSPQLIIHLYEELGAIAGQKIGISAFGVRPTSVDAPDGGVGFLPIIHGEAAGSIPLHLFEDTFLEFSAETDLLQRIALILRPNCELQVARASSLGDFAGGRIALGIRHGSPDGEAKPLITFPGGLQLSIRQLALTGGADMAAGSTGEVFLELGLLGGRLELSLDDADGFLKDSIGQKQFSAPFDLKLGWTSKEGIYFHGGSGLSVSLPVQTHVGPLSLRTLFLALNIENDGLEFEASVGGALSIGPLSASVERLGLRVDVSFGDGNLGIFGLDARFKPPSGVGIAVDGGVVHGGGFLSFDAAKGEYSGAMYLEMEGGISVTALGLISTRLPEGKPGYSLIVVVTAEGFKPIPLGFGFMLTGIGGLLGVHRTINVSALQGAVKSDALEGVLAPKDVVRNGAELLSRLGAFFPAARNHHFFGPMAEISWGTPPLVTIKLAVVLEFGERSRLVVLGRITAILPRREQDLVRLQMNVVGGIDFDERRAFLDAALFDSRLVNKFVITGEMRLRMRWDEQPYFALAVGGVHPAFTPPAGLEGMQRAAIVLADSENLKIRCESYLAITSNTVQFGARVDLVAKEWKFSISGQAGFDVLLQFDPFHFIAALYASLQLKAGSRSLFKVKFEGELSGPRPLRARGKASFEIWWWDYSVSFNTTLLGGSPPPAPQAIDVIKLLRQALVNPASWSAALVGRKERLVSLREEESPGVMRIHPLSVLTVKQNVVPLGLRITKYGNAAVAGGAKEFRVGEVQVGERVVSTEAVRDHFAPAQYREMSDEEKLSSPSFEMLEAGVSIGGGEAECGSAVTMAAEYEEVVIPEPEPKEDRVEERPRYTMEAGVGMRVGRWGTRRRGGMTSYRGASIAVTARSKVYKVLSKADLTEVEGPQQYRTRAEAKDAFAQFSKNIKSKLQIVAVK
jgi:Family of unknown function (DUF6603)